MAQWLRFGTARTVHLGPAIATGGFTAVTTLTASTVTALRIIKSAASSTITVTGRTFGHLTNGHGHYRLALTSTDTDTLGHLTVFWRASGTIKALAHWDRFHVVPANVYDSLVSGSDRLMVDSTQWAGATTATGDIALKNTLAKTTDITGFNDIAAADVWAVAARTLTSAATTWTAGTRTLTSGATAAASVWVSSTRTLTSAGVAWSAGTRTLTSAGAAWSAGTRTLTSGAAVLNGTVSELGALPAPSPQLRQAMGLIYVATRNTRMTSATGDKIHNSATAVLFTAPLSASSTVFTKGKYA